MNGRPSSTPSRGSCVLVTFGYALNDPPPRLAAASLAASGWDVTILQGPPLNAVESEPPHGVRVLNWREPWGTSGFASLHQLVRWLVFKRAVRRWIADVSPSLIITVMHRPLAALDLSRPRSYRLVSCIYDIPSLRDAGRIDRALIRRASRVLREADVVWASDRYRAGILQDLAHLPSLPIVVHNCPDLDYLPEPTWPRDGWLRAELRRMGANLGESGGCIVLRAGALGEMCGIDETLAAMQGLRDDTVFLMMGRPSAEYSQQVQSKIRSHGLQRRVLLWDRPSNEMWKRALAGADVGHLVHGPFTTGAAQRLFKLNSSLSNNRLYNYMAAGLPIISYDDPRMGDIHAEVQCFKIARLDHLAEDLRALLTELESSPDTRKMLGQAARRAHLRKYHWTLQFQPVLDAVLDGR